MRTASSREPLQPDTAWRRRSDIDKALTKICGSVQEILNGHSTPKPHDEVVEEYIQSLYEEVTGNKGTNHPIGWEHGHQHNILLYRMYYNNGELDEDFPAPNPPKEIVVPAEKPKEGATFQPYFMDPNKLPGNSAVLANIQDNAGGGISYGGTSMAAAISASNQRPPAPKRRGRPRKSDAAAAPAAAQAAAAAPVADIDLDRYSVIQEVKDHLSLLKEFEGIIPDEELVKRKRELFLALPPAPPVHGSNADSNKRSRAEL